MPQPAPAAHLPVSCKHLMSLLTRAMRTISPCVDVPSACHASCGLQCAIANFADSCRFLTIVPGYFAGMDAARAIHSLTAIVGMGVKKVHDCSGRITVSGS